MTCHEVAEYLTSYATILRMDQENMAEATARKVTEHLNTLPEQLDINAKDTSSILTSLSFLATRGLQLVNINANVISILVNNLCTAIDTSESLEEKNSLATNIITNLISLSDPNNALPLSEETKNKTIRVLITYSKNNVAWLQAAQSQHFIVDYVNHQLETSTPDTPNFDSVMQYISILLSNNIALITPEIETKLFLFVERMRTIAVTPSSAARTLYLLGTLMSLNKISKYEFGNHLQVYVYLFHQFEELMALNSNQAQLIIRCLSGMVRIAEAIQFIDVKRDANILLTSRKLIARLVSDKSNNQYKDVQQLAPYLAILAVNHVDEARQLLLWLLIQCQKDVNNPSMMQQLDAAINAIPQSLFSLLMSVNFVAQIKETVAELADRLLAKVDPAQQGGNEPQAEAPIVIPQNEPPLNSPHARNTNVSVTLAADNVGMMNSRAHYHPHILVISEELQQAMGFQSRYLYAPKHFVTILCGNEVSAAGLNEQTVDLLAYAVERNNDGQFIVCSNDRQQHVTAFMLACYLGHLNTIGNLLEAKANIKLTSLPLLQNALFFLIKGQASIEIKNTLLLELLTLNPSLATKLDNNQLSILHYCFIYDLVASVASILKVGRGPHSSNDTRDTLMSYTLENNNHAGIDYCISNNRVAMLRVLIERNTIIWLSRHSVKTPSQNRKIFSTAALNLATDETIQELLNILSKKNAEDCHQLVKSYFTQRKAALAQQNVPIPVAVQPNQEPESPNQAKRRRIEPSLEEMLAAEPQLVAAPVQVQIAAPAQVEAPAPIQAHEPAQIQVQPIASMSFFSLIENNCSLLQFYAFSSNMMNDTLTPFLEQLKNSYQAFNFSKEMLIGLFIHKDIFGCNALHTAATTRCFHNMKTIRDFLYTVLPDDAKYLLHTLATATNNDGKRPSAAEGTDEAFQVNLMLDNMRTVYPNAFGSFGSPGSLPGLLPPSEVLGDDALLQMLSSSPSADLTSSEPHSPFYNAQY